MADEVYEGAIGIDLGKLAIPVAIKAVAAYFVCKS